MAALVRPLPQVATLTLTHGVFEFGIAGAPDRIRRFRFRGRTRTSAGRMLLQEAGHRTLRLV